MTKPHFIVCVTCVGGRLVYDSIRAMRDAADYTVSIVGIDANGSAEGRLLCDEFQVLPMAEHNPEAWVEGLLKLQARFGIQGLVCLSDEEARVAAQHRDLLGRKGIRTSVSQWNTVNVMTDKLLLLQTLAASGVEVGAFASVDSVETAGKAVEELGYPERQIVLKPRKSRGSRGVLVCDAAQDQFKLFLPDRFCGTGRFELVLNELQQRNIGLDHWVAVPYWEGPVFDVDCLVANGKVVMTAARKRQLRNPFWPTSTGHIIDMDSRVLNYAERLCEILGVEGAGDFDIVLREDGTAVPFDASARFSGSIGGSYVAGGNFLAQLLRVMFDLPLVPYAIRDKTPLRPFITMAKIPSRNADILL